MADKRIQQYPDKNNPSSSDYILIADSQDIDVNGFRKYKKIKISALDNIVITNAEDIERLDLIQLLNDNDAVIGRFYRITDSQIGEPILVQAVALNMISEMSVSGDDGIVYFYDIVTDTRTNIQHIEINGTGFVKANGTTITYDNSTYLTNINGITAGGELSGTYPNPSLSNNAVTGKVLTGLSISGSSITSTDSILTSLGKLQNQINSLVGGVKYQGTWNASTNTPTLVSSVGTSGFYYVVDVAGSTNLNGITDWKVGDWAIFNGTTWQKVDNTDSVISVNGYTGAVTLTTSDIAEGTNLYYTDARVRQAISESIVGINYDNNTGVFSLASGYVIPTTTEQSNWNTAYNSRISSLTTVGTSGAATLVSNTLNIPNYTLGGLGGVPYTGATANVDLGEFGIKAGYFGYDLTPTNTPTTQGTTYWDSAEETVALIMNGAIQHIGLDTFYNVKNGTGSTILKGTAVRFDGTDGGSGHLLIAPMLANGFYPSTYYMGITAEDIGSGDFGKVMQFGKLRGINTNSYTNGDILYVSTSSAGGFQTTVPTAPNNIIIAAAVVRASNNGTLMVRATLGSNINSDEGVKITSPTTGQLLQLQSNGLWENKTKAQVLGGTSSQFVKGDGSLDSTSYQPLDSDLTAIAGLSGDGLLRKTSGTWGMDTNTYLTANQTITISGEASGSGATSITLSLDNNSVTGKVLNGLSISGGSVVSTDSILVGIGKLQNQVNALAGGVNYQGTWNASTNTPSLTSGVGVKGYYYVVSVAGSTNLDGITDWKLGDWAIFNGSTWQKVDNTDAVISVNGYTGAVTLTKSDVGLSNVENTALSTWAGSTNITTLGTIGTGVWNGTAIGDSYISSASTWNAKIGGSGTSGKLPKFTASGTIGNSIVSESAGVISVAGALNITSTAPYIELTDSTNGIVHYLEGNDTSLVLYSDFGNTQSGSLIDFRIDGNTSRMSLSATELITFGADDTGEAHIFGGSARVNGALTVRGSGSSIVDSANSFALSIGASSANPNFVAIGTSGSGVPQINGYNNAFSATTSLALQPNGSNVLIGTTTDNNTDKLQVSGSLKVTGASTFGVFNANTPAIFTTNNTASTPAITAFKNTEDGNADVLLIQSYFGGTGIVDVARIKANGAATFSSSVTWGSASGQYMYAGGASHIFAYSNSTSNYLYSGGSGGFNINNAADSAVLMRVTDGGNVGIGVTNPSQKLGVQASDPSNGIILAVSNNNGGNATTGSKILFDASGIGNFWEGMPAGVEAWAVGLFNGSTNPEYMRITSGGNVGIGTTSPTSKLSISDGATMYASQTGTFLDIKANVSNGNDTTSRVGLRLGNNSNAFNIWYGGTTDRLRFADGGGNEILTLVNGGASASSLTVGSTIHTSKAGSISGYYLNLNTFNTGNQYPLNKINGAYMAFPNSTNAFIQSAGGDRFSNHNWYSNDGLSHMKFGQLEANGTETGGGLFDIRLNSGDWWEEPYQELRLTSEEGFYALTKSFLLSIPSLSGGSVNIQAPEIYLTASGESTQSQIRMTGAGISTSALPNASGRIGVVARNNSTTILQNASTLEINTTAYNNGGILNYNPTNAGKHLQFPNANGQVVNQSQNYSYVNHNWFAFNPNYHFKFGNYVEPGDGGGALLDIKMTEPGDWGASGPSYLYWSPEEAFTLQNYAQILFASVKQDGTESARIIISGEYSRLDLQETKRIKLNPLTTTQVNALTATAQEGDVVYNLTLDTICFYNGSSWRQVSHTAM